MPMGKIRFAPAKYHIFSPLQGRIGGFRLPFFLSKKTSLYSLSWLKFRVIVLWKFTFSFINKTIKMTKEMDCVLDLAKIYWT
jgi:hypothetical protein